MAKSWTVIDLFSGAGGLSEGFRQAGAQVRAANDFDKAAGETFASTHPDAVFFGGPIEKISAAAFLAAACLKRGELDCLVGGPPCQGFSVYNHQRGLEDPRSGLYREYLRLVEGLNPKWVVLENVTGMASTGAGATVEAILVGLRKLGYVVEQRILKAEEYGVPQERRRIVFIGNRLGLPIAYPEKTHGPGLLPYVTVNDALGDLPTLENGEDRGAIPYACPAFSDYQKELRGHSVRVHNHSATKLSQMNMQRMQHIPVGGSWRDIPFELLPAGMKKAKRSDHTKRYGRLRPEGLSSTILTKCDVHWGAYIHPTQNRSLTVREAARLQSFPDWFVFKGSRTEQFVQVGNAVPPLLGRKIALAIMGVAEGAKADMGTDRENTIQPLSAALMAAS